MPEPVTELIGVYDADSTLLGEVSYWIGARLGLSHCSLCDLTHGLFTVKDEWKQCERSLSVPFRTFHRNDAPTDVVEAAAGSYPVVLARREGGLSVAVSSAQLESLGGSTGDFALLLRDFLDATR